MNTMQMYYAFKTLMTKEILRFARIWVQTIIPPVITTALYLLIFGNLIGERIGDMDGHSYVNFIIPGLVMMTIITNSYANVVSSFFGSKFQGNIAELLISPMPNWLILMGFVGGGIARGLCVGIAVLLISFMFVDIQVHSWGLTLLVAVLTAALFSFAGLINGIYAESFDDITIIPTFVLTPLTYLGGVFYSLELVSEFWKNVSLGNPVVYMINAFRYGLLGSSDISIGVSLFIIVAFLAALYAVCLYLLAKGIGIRH